MNNYLNLVAFSHTIFALPFALVGFSFALISTDVELDLSLLLYVVLCMVFARSAAMAFNRYIDEDIDAKNERTKIREIPSGKLSKSNVLLFVLINCILFVITCYFINPLCFYLSPVALAVVLLYSYTKRYTFLCHIILGIGLALAPIGAYLAVYPQFSLVPLYFGISILFWVAGFDIIYALQDEEFDRRNNLFSIPVKFGRNKSMILSKVFHVISAVFIALATYHSYVILRNWFCWVGLGVFLLMLIYQHTLVKPNDLSRVNRAFFTTNGIASVVYGLFYILGVALV